MHQKAPTATQDNTETSGCSGIREMLGEAKEKDGIGLNIRLLPLLDLSILVKPRSAIERIRLMARLTLNGWWLAYVVWVIFLVAICIFVFVSIANAQNFDDRWTSGTAPVMTTPNVVTIAPQIAINPQITITPNITVNPPTVTVTVPTPMTTPVPSGKPPIPKTLYQAPRHRVQPPIIVRRYIYEDDYRPMTDLSVPADRVNRSDRPGCNGIACYP